MTVAHAKTIVASIEKSLNDASGLHTKVTTAFAALDTDQSGMLDMCESRKLVGDLCAMMNLPPPTEEEFLTHFAALDSDKDGGLNANEVGSGVVGALTYKMHSLKHYLQFAERDTLDDAAQLPLC